MIDLLFRAGIEPGPVIILAYSRIHILFEILRNVIYRLLSRKSLGNYQSKIARRKYPIMPVTADIPADMIIISISFPITPPS